MIRDEIIRMARQIWPTPSVLPMDEIDRFAELVVATEREACAKVCDERSLRNEAYAQDAIANVENSEVSSLRAAAWHMKVCATEIRHRCDE